ncbi:c-type cytochrome [Paraglaciecola arctica]|uniref:Cytochrome c family protein n=1 Tax=Paraglaciecola arctica BSs20135 TaxID=493475 RepID=K6Y5Z5_9ALTE|nr:c-type cytochrome [Paraglaciecola arctica]GAC19356.1 cytochrome c family protein [Paraglaciecola arctica BSs20135]
MRIKHWIIRALCCAGVITHVYAQANDAQQIYASCSACHGEQGQGNPALNAPAIAGQYDWYLKRQLQHFANGIRGSHAEDIHGKTMVPFAKLITNEQQQVLAVYISQLKPVSANVELNGDLKNGSRYYQAKCGACHGGKAQGNISFNAPKLSALDPQYLLRQMTNFKQGIRGQHQEDKWGRQMAMMSTTVSDQELEDILFFISEQAK